MKRARRAPFFVRFSALASTSHITLSERLQRIVRVRPDEVHAMLWSFAYFFCLLAAYYVPAAAA